MPTLPADDATPEEKRIHWTNQGTANVQCRPQFIQQVLEVYIPPVQPSLPVLIYRLQAVGSKRGSGLWGPAVQIQPRKKIYGRTRQKPIINLLQKSLPHLKEN
jgi:hypothetical protein